MSKYRLLAVDLDGTLLDDRGQVPPENARALLRAQQAGVEVALCTGRNVRDAKLFSDALLAPADWFVTSNGADVCAPNGKTIFAAKLQPSICQDILQLCRQFQSDPCFFANEAVYYGDEFKWFVEQMQQHGHLIDFLEINEYQYIASDTAWQEVLAREREQLNKAILYHRDLQVVNQIERALEQDGRFELAPSVMFGGLLKNIEVNARGVHKGAGLAALAAHLGMEMRQVMALGDSHNDLTMLRQAGLGVAMQNAAPEIQQAADEIAPSNVEFGVARAIERYILAGE